MTIRAFLGSWSLVWLGVRIRSGGRWSKKGVTFVYWEEGGSLVMVLAWGHQWRPVRSQVTPWGRLVGGRERGGEGERGGGGKGEAEPGWKLPQAESSSRIWQRVLGKLDPWKLGPGSKEREGGEVEGRVKLSKGESCHKLSHPQAHLRIWQITSTIAAPFIHICMMYISLRWKDQTNMSQHYQDQDLHYV